MKKDPKIYLQHILEAIGDIQKHMASMDRERFFEDIKTQDAVIRKISIIGEIVKRLPVQMKEREEGIPWKKIAGMRDLVIHDYSEIDLQTVWSTATKMLAPVESAVLRLLKLP